MLQYLKKYHPSIPCSLEIEKSRPDIASLFHLTNVLLFSEDYVLKKDKQDPTDFLLTLKKPHETIATCTWGSHGAWLIDDSGTVHNATPSNNSNIIDTLAAGDTFNAGLIHALCIKKPQHQALDYATQLANHKCRQSGLAGLTLTFNYREQ